MPLLRVYADKGYSMSKGDLLSNTCRSDLRTPKRPSHAFESRSTGTYIEGSHCYRVQSRLGL